MGGIYGFTFHHAGEGQGETMLRGMAERMAFRGACRDIFCSREIGMGISAHGYESAQQVVFDAGRSVIAVCEGEIYNSEELVQSLKQPPPGGAAEGFSLVPFLYREKGKDFPRAINGIFTIALWDTAQRRLVMVRDHLGSHSLFYAQHGSALAFASTIKSLLTLKQIKAELDSLALERYLAALAVSPPSTMYHTIFALRPGHLVSFQDGRAEEYAYWPLGAITEERTVPRGEFAGRIRSVFEDAVKVRARSPGKVGALISGGVDTSAVVAALFEKAGLQTLQGFSIAFDERDFSDASLQQIMYVRYPIQPHQIVLKPLDFAAALTGGSRLLDSPVNDVAYAGMYHVLRAAAAQGCEYIFEGEGSDEIFCTGHSRGELEIQKYLFLPHFLRRLLFGGVVGSFSEGGSFLEKVIRMVARIGMSDLQRRSTWIPVFSSKTRQRLLGRGSTPYEDLLPSAQAFYQETRLQDSINIYQYGLTRLFLADDLLYKNERMASGAGVVNRTPFIDYRLVEEAFRIPAAYKIGPADAGSDGTKLIFKDAARGLVPDEVLDRKKTRGFSQPTAIWYHSALKDFVADHLMAPDARVFHWLDKQTVQTICSDFWQRKISNDYFVNSLLILELWLRSNE